MTRGLHDQQPSLINYFILPASQLQPCTWLNTPLPGITAQRLYRSSCNQLRADCTQGPAHNPEPHTQPWTVLEKSTAMTEVGFKINYCSFRRHTEILKGKGKHLERLRQMKRELANSKSRLPGRNPPPSHCVEEEAHWGSGTGQLLFKTGQSIPQEAISALQRGNRQRSPSGKAPTPPRRCFVNLSWIFMSTDKQN